MGNKDLFTIGVIVAPHGVRGDIRIMPETDFPERFLDMESCYIDGKIYNITSARFHKQFVLMTFAEVTSRDEAELLMRKEIQVGRDDLMPLPEGRYYIYDLIGLDVYDTANNHLGKLKEVLQPGANDVYVVGHENEKTELLLPVIDSVVLDIDIEQKRVIVDPPEWI